MFLKKEQLPPVTRASKTKCSIYKPDTKPYDIFWKRSYNDTQFK